MDFSTIFIFPSPAFIMSCFPAEETRKLCCSTTSLVISKLFYGISIFVFAVVGAVLGVLIGVFVGAKTTIGCLHGARVGAIKGSYITINLFKISLIVCSSGDMSTTYLLRPINEFDSSFNGVTWNEELSKDSMKNIPSIRITEQNIWDSSCSICLEDLVHGEIVQSLPRCRHMFHVSCIKMWLNGHKSCPLCRRHV